MPPIRPIFVAVGLCALALPVLASPAWAAPPQKPPQSEAAQSAQKPVKKLPAKAAEKAEEPPPGVRIQPPPGQPAVKSKQPAAANKAAAKPAKKKKRSATRKKTKKVKTGRAAASTSPMDGVDRNQLAVDRLKDAADQPLLELLASYKEVLENGDLETAAILIRLAANEEPSHALVTQINDLLGIALDTQDTQALLEVARARRADTVIGNLADKRPKTGPPKTGAGSDVHARIHSAHEAAKDTPRRGRLEALAIYKRAIAENNAEAAALALGGVVHGPVDAKSISQANALLGLRKGIATESNIAP